MSSASRLLPDLLDKDADRPATGEAYIPGGLIGDTKLKHFRFAARDHIQRLGDDGALDATAGDRAQERAVIVDDEIGAGWPRRGTPGFDHGRQCHAVTRLLPVLRGFQNVFVAIEHGSLAVLVVTVQAADRIRP